MASTTSIVKAGSDTFSTLERIEHPDRLFNRIRAQLQSGNLPKALEILQPGLQPGGLSSIHRNLIPDNIKMMIPYLSGTKKNPDGTENPEETNRLRCARLTKCMEKTFPDIFQLEVIKKKGIEAGLTAEQVDEALVQVQLKDGFFWAIKATHNDEFEAWENSLVALAANNKINFQVEGCVRATDHENMFSKIKTGLFRGQLRGLESESSYRWLKVWGFYEKLFESSYLFAAHLGIVNVQPFHPVVVEYIVNCMHRPLFFQNLEKTATASSSKVAIALHKTLKDLHKKEELTLGGYRVLASKVLAQFPDPRDWAHFLEALMPIAFADCSQEAQKAVNDLIGSGTKYKDNLSKDNLSIFSFGRVSPEKFKMEKLESSGLRAETVKFVDSIRRPRDIFFAQNFCSEWPGRNKDVITVVMFGSNHFPGFQEEVLARAEDKADRGDSKADNKNNESNKG